MRLRLNQKLKPKIKKMISYQVIKMLRKLMNYLRLKILKKTWKILRNCRRSSRSKNN